MWPTVHGSYGPNTPPDIRKALLLRGIILALVFFMQLHTPSYMTVVAVDFNFDQYKRPRRVSIVPTWAVFIIVFIPLIFFAIPMSLGGHHRDVMQAFLAWSLALSINAMITEFFKLAIGRPRPDFFYRCYPDGQMARGYTGRLDEIIEGRKSFPSGHSSFSFCSMGFLSLWLCGRLGALSPRREKVPLIILVLCLSPLVLASGVAVSRYLDNHHHWEDVAFGILIGFTSSFLCYSHYYHPLDSELSGYPKTLARDELGLTIAPNNNTPTE